MSVLKSGPVAQLLPFEQVYRTNVGPVFLFVLSQVSRRSDAEDLTADVFAAAFAAYDASAPGPDAVRPWLMRIARNTVVDFHRRTGRRTALLARLFGPAQDPSADVERTVVGRDELRLVLRQLKRMSPRDRVLVGLRVAGDLSYAEIGAVIGVSEHAAMTATRRAVQRLRAMCEEAT